MESPASAAEKQRVLQTHGIPRGSPSPGQRGSQSDPTKQPSDQLKQAAVLIAAFQQLRCLCVPLITDCPSAAVCSELEVYKIDESGQKI